MVFSPDYRGHSVAKALLMAGEEEIARFMQAFQRIVAEEVGPVSADAREARDKVLQLSAKLEGQNVGAQIEKLTGAMATMEQGLRSDIVNQHARLKNDMADQDKVLDDHGKRIRLIEDELQRGRGRNTVFGWMLRHLPGPLIGALTGLMAALGFDRKFG